LRYPETDRPKPVLNNFNIKFAKPKASFSILPTNIPIPWHRNSQTNHEGLRSDSSIEKMP
jgi:hypothetical protein